MKKLFYILIFICSIFQINAQNTSVGILKGEVIDGKSKLPLVGASIRILENNSGAASDINGKFEILNVPVGVYTVQINYIGYNIVLKNYQSVLKDKTTMLEVELQESDSLMNSAYIKGFRHEETSNAGVSIFSFSREEISLNPGAQGDIFRAIGMLPGVTSSGGIYSAIAVRGQGVRDNVYMVDDIPLTELGHLEGNSFFNDPNGGRFSIFAPRVIDNAVFQGGAFNSEFGRKSASYLGLQIKEGNKVNPILDGQIDLLGFNVNYDGPSYFHKKTNMFLSLRYQNFLPLVNLIGLKNLGLPIYGDIILKTSTQINSKNKLNFLFMVCPESFERDIYNLEFDKPLNLLYLPDFKRNKIIAGANLKTTLNSKTVLKNIVYFTNYSSDVSVGKAYPIKDSNGTFQLQNIPFINPIQTQQYSENKFGFRTLLETTVTKKNRIVFGLEGDILSLNNNRTLLINDTSFVFRKTSLSDTSLKYQVISPEFVNAKLNKSAYNASVFINYYFQVFRNLHGQLGVRSDYNGFAEQIVLAPRVNLTYNFKQKNSLTFGFGTYYQDPIYSEIADLPVNTNLKMEKISQYILSYKRYFPSSLKLMVEVWYKSFDGMVVTPIAGTVLRNNNGKGYGHGLDISLTKRLTKQWHGIISYSYMQVQRNDQDGLGYYMFTFSQPHQINTMLSYTLNTNWSFSGKYRYATGRPTDNFVIHSDILNNPNNPISSMELIGRNASRLPYFSSLDLRANYSFQYKKYKLISFFDIVNILNRQIANSENFNHLTGNTYYDGLAIFPTGGLKFEF